MDNFASRRPKRCPECGSARVVCIVYGMPGEGVREDVSAGRVALGGCCVSEADPSWRCLDCDAAVYATRLKAYLAEHPIAEGRASTLE